MRQDLCLTAIQAQHADLGTLRIAGSLRGIARREESDARSVGTPARRTGIETLRSQASRRGLAIDIDQPDRRVAAIALLVDCGENVRHLLAVRRNVRIANR